jgi:RNA polymerase-binding transcription factor DksA
VTGDGRAAEEAAEEAGGAGVELDKVEATLTAVVAALTRLDEGRYDRCGRCGAPLVPEVLAADPLADRCPDRCGATP